MVKTEGKELPDRTFEEAGRLAAYYSKGREQEKVEIDYVQKKQVKKPAGAKPGFVVYYTNYSLMIDSDISGIEKISDWLLTIPAHLIWSLPYYASDSIFYA